VAPTDLLFQLTVDCYADFLEVLPEINYSTLHTLWGCAVELASALAAATILADAAVTPSFPK